MAFLAPVDPVGDAVHGDFDPRSVAAGWARPITEAFRVEHGDDDETLSLLGRLRGSLDDRPDGRGIVTPFEEELDAAVAAALRASDPPLNHDELDSVRVWYYEYLVRLFALSRGIFGHRAAVEKYTSTWRHLQKVETATELPEEISLQIEEMILPAMQTSGGVRRRYLSILSPKTDAVTNVGSAPRVLLQVTEHLRLRGTVRGDFIELELQIETEAGRSTKTRVNLDFAVLREALVCNAALGHGITESTIRETPRLERFRAAVLVGHRRVPNSIKLVSVNAPAVTLA